MAQKSTDKSKEAEARTQETRGFIRKVKRKTRRKFTAEEKICVVLEGIRHEVSVRELCRREGIAANTYYSWLKDFMEAGKERLKHDSARDATRAEVEDLKRQNMRLKQLVAELSLEVYLLKKTAIPGLE
jgi:transposase